MTFQETTLHIEFREKSVGSRVLHEGAESERTDLIKVSCDGETGVNVCEMSFCAGRVAYGVAIPHGTRHEKMHAEETHTRRFCCLRNTGILLAHKS